MYIQFSDQDYFSFLFEDKYCAFTVSGYPLSKILFARLYDANENELLLTSDIRESLMVSICDD